MWANIRIDLPKEWGENAAVNTACWLNEWTSGSNFTEKTIQIPAATLTQDRYDLNMIVTANGFPSKMHIPLVFVRK